MVEKLDHLTLEILKSLLLRIFFGSKLVFLKIKDNPLKSCFRDMKTHRTA